MKMITPFPPISKVAKHFSTSILQGCQTLSADMTKVPKRCPPTCANLPSQTLSTSSEAAAARPPSTSPPSQRPFEAWHRGHDSSTLTPTTCFCRVWNRCASGKRRILSTLVNDATWPDPSYLPGSSRTETMMWVFLLSAFLRNFFRFWPLTRWCASTLDAALLCSSRAGSDFGHMFWVIYIWIQWGSNTEHLWYSNGLFGFGMVWFSNGKTRWPPFCQKMGAILFDFWMVQTIQNLNQFLIGFSLVIDHLIGWHSKIIHFWPVYLMAVRVLFQYSHRAWKPNIRQLDWFWPFKYWGQSYKDFYTLGQNLQTCPKPWKQCTNKNFHLA